MRIKIVSGVIAAIVVATAAGVAQSPSGAFELISVSSAGVQGNNESGTLGFTTPNTDRASMSSDGNIIAFMSAADNLVPGDTNLMVDVFVRNRKLGTTERVSVTSKGRQGDRHSGLAGGADISDNGNFVVFASEASNFARGDTNGNNDVFIHDRATGTTELVSRGLDGTPATGESPVISGDGQFVAFRSSSNTLVSDGNPNSFSHIYVWTRATQAIERIDVDSNEVIAENQSSNPAISADGRFVAFESSADNLAPGPGDQQGIDVFVRDRVNGTTEGISTVGDSGVFEADSFLSSITPDGRFVGFSSGDPTFGLADTNGFSSDAFVFDRQSRTVQLVSRNSSGVQANEESFSPLVAADGASVVFTSRASNLVANDTNGLFDVFRRDLATGTTVRLATDSQASFFPVIGSDITPDGLVVSMLTRAELLPEQNVGIFAFDVYVNLPADLAVTNTDAPDPVAVRANLTYTVKVQNNGPGAANEVTLTDQLSADAAFVSATATQGSCSRAGKGTSDGVLTCALGTIDAFQSATVTIVVSPTRAGATLTNTAAAQSSSTDPAPANDTATATTTVLKK
jgi:uncharacterized repeat protein (TIGR01451 family)